MTISWSPEDGLYVVEVPDLPGCFADGRTRAEAVAHAERVIADWLEEAQRLGRPVPEPSMELPVGGQDGPR